MFKSKKLWQSKTFWANTLSLAAIVGQYTTGYMVSAEVQVSLLAAVNILLRSITKSEIDWT